MSSGKILLGMLTGVAVGTTLGVLFAPNKGVDTRKKITNQGNDLTNSLLSKFNGIMDKMSSRMDMMKDDVVHSAYNGKAEVKDAYNDVVSKVKLP